MKTTPLFSRQFHLQTLNKKSRSSAQKMEDKIAAFRDRSIDQLGKCFSKIIPGRLLKSNPSGKHSRTRIFSKEITFWAFFSQTINADGGCAEVMAKLKAFFVFKKKVFSISTGAYCKARMKLDKAEMKEIFDHTAGVHQSLEKRAIEGRRVLVVDGTGVTAADTSENQAVWPQQATQKEGCGFPSIRVLPIFSLETGAMLSFRTGNKKSHELRLFREQFDVFNKGDINLADKMFSGYFDLATLLSKGVDSVVTLPAKKRKPIADTHCVKKLSDNDLIITWKKPVWTKKSAYTYEEWKALPATLTLRQIKVTVEGKGFRTKSFYIITTLLDAIEYPSEDLAELYFRRWEVELNIDDIKTTLGMDHLRCKTPDMVDKELLMYFIAYNAIRWAIYEAAKRTDIDHQYISFKGALQAIRNWEPQLNQAKLSPVDLRRLLTKLYITISENIVLQRPNRREPRCIKRRPKPYQLLTSPRGQMKEIEHRSKYHANAA